MNMLDIIERKRQGLELPEEDIRFFVNGYCGNEIPDYQVSALLMAICLQGMSPRETTALALEMARSGDIIELSGVNGVTVDKHSSGGVGDKTTLVVAPMAAACGLKIAKMSGRGLGFTGGTIDKLESIHGFRTSLSEKEFVEIVNRIGFALTGQTGNIAPADKKLYALRDVSGTVASIPLIASSIMSKKLAVHTDAIVLDVKCGSGAFLQGLDEAVSLARQMVAIGTGAGRKTIAAITDMKEPLGFAVGNALEVREAVETLRGHGPADITELCLALGSQMLLAGGIVEDISEARRRLERVLADGSAWGVFRGFVEAQGGELAPIEHPELLPRASIQLAVPSPQDGVISAIDAREIGLCAHLTGAGRSTKADAIDHAAGIVLYKKVGDTVRRHEPLCTVHANTESKAREAAKRVFGAFRLGEAVRLPMLRALVTAEGEEFFDAD